MPTCHFTEKLCGPHTLDFYQDVENVISTLKLWTAMASTHYKQLNDFIFAHCKHKDEYSGALFDFILAQHHFIARKGWAAWEEAVKSAA